MQQLPSCHTGANHTRVNNTRATLRKAIRNKRLALSATEHHQAAQDVLARFTQVEAVKMATKIALYWSVDGELNTQPLIDYCLAQGKQVYLPAIHPVCRGHLLFLHYNPNSTLVKNAFGILEPILDVRAVLPCAALDVICTPLVAFDVVGQRLGMGGGYYDRMLAPYFSNENKTWVANSPYPIGLAHDCQQLDNLPSQAWDVPLPEILTPSRHWRWVV